VEYLEQPHSLENGILLSTLCIFFIWNFNFLAN